MNRIREFLVAAACIGIAAGCSGALEPFQEIELRTEVAPAVVAVGDTVTIRAIMRNSTSRTLETGRACGPPVLFEFRNAGGDVVHPIELNSAFTCPLLDYHLVEPHETDTVTMRWRVELKRGEWSVRSGFHRGANLQRLTPAVTLTVNERNAIR